MHIIYDGRVMAEQYSGLGRFAGELLFTLLDAKNAPDVRFTVVIWANKQLERENFYYSRLRQYEKSGSCRVLEVPCRPISLGHHFSLSRYINTLDGDIYFYPHFDLPLCVNIPSVVVIHDLHPLKCEGYIIKDRILKMLYFKFMLRVVAKKAAYIFAVSETTRKDFLSEVGLRFGNKVGVSGEGPITHVSDTDSVVMSSKEPPEHFLLYVGGRRPNKNIKRIVDLYILLKDKADYTGKLLMVGSARNYGFDLEKYIKGRNDVITWGQVDDSMLGVLYQKMDALIFLSKYEGFGLPVIEASQFKKKIIVSDGGALPEISPSWVCKVPNDADLEKVVFQVRDYLNNAIVFDSDYAKKYNWYVTAERMMRKFIDTISDFDALLDKKHVIETKVIRDFGFEWSRFDQAKLSPKDRQAIFDNYFRIFPWQSISSSSVGADIGCGSGRWASLVAPRVAHLHLVDSSGKAIAVARRNLSDVKNVSFHQASVSFLPFEKESLDFVYSIGVLHHVVNAERFISSIGNLLKPGAPFLLYLYYAFEQRPVWYRSIWRVSDIVRRIVSRMPNLLKNATCEAIALFIYLPLARSARVLDRFSILPQSWPLAYYRNHKYYVMRTDALDRFGTRLERRFTRKQIDDMLKTAGFTDIRFSESQPYWCAVGIKKG